MIVKGSFITLCLFLPACHSSFEMSWFILMWPLNACVCLKGVVAECQQERSQLKNRAKAMTTLRAKLYSMKLEEETSKRYNQRKVQVRLHLWSFETAAKDLKT